MVVSKKGGYIVSENEKRKVDEEVEGKYFKAIRSNLVIVQNGGLSKPQ